MTGVVRDAADGTAVPGACIEPFPDGAVGAYRLFDVLTSGRFDTGAVPGTYKVRFGSCEAVEGLAAEWLGGSSSETARPVVLAPGATVDLRASLAAGGAISGRVTDTATGAALEGICVAVYPAGSDVAHHRFARTDAGRFRVPGLGSGR